MKHSVDSGVSISNSLIQEQSSEIGLIDNLTLITIPQLGHIKSSPDKANKGSLSETSLYLSGGGTLTQPVAGVGTLTLANGAFTMASSYGHTSAGVILQHSTLDISIGVTIEPISYNQAAVDANVANDLVVNVGSIVGFGSVAYYRGGTGVSLAIATTLSNLGTITGGRGGYNGYGVGYDAGVALTATGATINNSGQIIGGSGAFGGDGAYLHGGTLTNFAGDISGGVGGSSDRGYFGGSGGTGLILSDGCSAINDGTLDGALGGSGVYEPGFGGDGADITDSSLLNAGLLAGGIGGSSYYGGGYGGVGARVDNSTLTNSGTIMGGQGGAAGRAFDGRTFGFPGGYPGGGGGSGVVVNGGTLTNAGMISGGAGGSGPAGSGAMGYAVSFGPVASTLIIDPGAVFMGRVTANPAAGDLLDLAGTTAGTLYGLGSQFSGFALVDLIVGSTWTIDSTVATVDDTQFEGVEMQDSLYLVNGGTLDQSSLGFGTITLANRAFGIAQTYGGSTTAGFVLNSSTLDVAIGGSLSPGVDRIAVDALIASDLFMNYGGATGGVGSASGGPGSSGAAFGFGASLSNYGTLTGGTGGYGASQRGQGGSGASSMGGSLVNHGLLSGGVGANGSGSVSAGGGGSAAYLAGGTLTNSTGTISGGAGGHATLQGGQGGVGIVLSDAAMVVNQALITGGIGGYSTTSKGGNGGAGAYLNGGTLTNAGTISGGRGGSGAAAGLQGDSVQFGSAIGTLVVDPGAVFNGQVAANASVSDVLQLEGRTAATLTGLGSQFTGFSDLTVGSGAAWTIAGPATFGGTIQLSGALTVSAGVVVTAGAAGGAAATLDAASAMLTNGGTLTGGTATGSAHGGQGALVSFGTLVNSGLLQGGKSSSQARGGVGVSVSSGAFVQNSGTIRGASGGKFGGAGANVYGTAVNSGLIVAGTGSNGNGNGVVLAGGTLTNAGTITGATAGDAVMFGQAASTLIVDPGAVFNGAVVANASYADMLQLAGTGFGTLTGLGTQFTAFSSLVVDGGANWTLATGDSFAGPTTIIGTLIVDGGGTLGAVSLGAGSATLAIDPGATFSGQVAATAGAQDTLELGGTTASTLTGFGDQFTNFATLSFETGAVWTIDSTVAAAQSATIVGAASQDALYLSGGGTLAHAVAGLGTLSLGNSAFTMASSYGRTSAKIVLNGGTLLASAGVTIVGVGVTLNGGSLTNAGDISGVQFGATAGTLIVDPGALFTGQITANAAASDVLQLAGASPSTLTGLGSQFTGFSELLVGSGATWTLAGPATFGGTVMLAGSLTVDSNVVLAASALGSAAATLNASAAVLTNQGTLIGGAEVGTLHGGQGALLTAGTLVNSGTLQGGSSSSQARGGVGVSVSAGALLQNSGTIRGSAGKYGGAGANVYGVAVNSGLIAAGSGTNGTGNGVVLTGGTLTNAGTIAGAANGDAVQFGKASGTLVVDPGAVFNGAVVANASYNDLLQLAGSAAGTLTGLGSQFTNFASLVVDAGANWTLASGDSFAASTSVAGTLTVDQGVTLGAVVIGPAKATLTIDPGATFTGEVNATAGAGDILSLGGTTAGTLTGFGSQFANFATLALQAGAVWTIDSTVATAAATAFTGQSAKDTLELSGGGILTKADNGFGTLQLDGSTAFQFKTNSGLSAGNIIVDVGAVLQGAGTLAAAVVATGEVLVGQAAVLGLGGTVTGAGVLSSSSGGTLTLSGGFDLSGKLTGTGEIILASAGTLATGIQLAAQAIVQKANLVLGGTTTIAGQLHDYDLITSSAGQTITLTGPASRGVTNDGTLTASGPGTSEILAGVTNNGALSVASGTFSLIGAITNMSTLSALGGMLFVSEEVTGAGNIYISSASTLDLQAGAASTETVNFLATTGLLDLADPLAMAGEISGFSGTDKIDLIDTAATKLSFSDGVLTVSNGATTVASLHFSGSFTTQNFVLSSDHNGGALITYHG